MAIVHLPRITEYLRTTTDICAPWAKHIPYDPEELVRKRKELKERQAKSCSLEVIINYFTTQSDVPPNRIEDMVASIRTLAQEIVGSNSTPQVIEGSTVFLIDTLKDCKLIGKRHTEQLQRMFGAYSSKTMEKALITVKQLIQSLTPDAQEDLLNKGFPKKDDIMDEKEFGSKIKFNNLEPLDDSYCTIPIRTYDDNYLNSSSLDKLSFKFQGQAKKALDKGPSKSLAKKERFDRVWLEREIAKFGLDDPDGMSVELTSSVIENLKSNKSNDELQNELFELLGFDRIELIQDILKHRESIAFSKARQRIDEDFVKKRLDAENKPSIMRQVVVQSETEKLLSKQIRKDEKRIQRSQNAASADESSDLLDPRYLKFMREAQLLVAKSAPIFTKPPRAASRSNYPNVYDSFAEVTASAAFISSQKLCLPANHIRVNNAVFEEITIPAVKRDCSHIVTEKVPVSALDPIGRSAFDGVKELNLIQSAVFNIAYNTNENMLVCAPTGAGKTNVALLTILHEIKNNMEGINIKRDDFKIIYVAPMKALASEMVRNFKAKLKPLQIEVRELTGDMQLTKTEILRTQMIVTTPEKWDVVTRKSSGDGALSQKVKLLILDEVHLIDGDRGPVVEAIVARTLRKVETSQSMIRILGLSATLPNYADVARFLRVNLMVGLFFFDDRFRPVPLSQSFVGVKAASSVQQIRDMDEVCYEKVKALVEKKHQVMVFVHARVATVRTATVLRDLAKKKNQLLLFTHNQDAKFGAAQNQILKSRNKQLRELFSDGFAIHHAGMLRSDRNNVERYFQEGHIKVLVCTSTLAWGVNLPARAVIIKGTEIYDSKKGTFVDIGVLDVMQIFGRAGRPQFDTEGQGTIITLHEKLPHYLSLLTRQHQIESNFENNLVDNLNAEVSLGTVTNIDEGVTWLSYTYLYIRMMSNPHAYGIKPAALQEDFQLFEHRRNLIIKAAEKLDAAKMVSYCQKKGILMISDLGRTASDYYINYDTVTRFNETLKNANPKDNEILDLVSTAKEFDQLKVRQDEMNELDHHLYRSCMLPVKGGTTENSGKVNILLQAYLSRSIIDTFSLVSDQNYVIQNAPRILRYLFEVSLRERRASRTTRFLEMSKMMEKRMWSKDTPLRQFGGELSNKALEKIEGCQMGIEGLLELDHMTLSAKTHCFHEKEKVYSCLHQIPNLNIETYVQPITSTILRITLCITPEFDWNVKFHGMGSEAFWILVLNPDNERIYHFEYFLLPRKQVIAQTVQELVFTIPLGHGEQPTQYIVQAISDRWLGSDRWWPINYKGLILPQHHQPQTELLDLDPLPVTALKNSMYQSIYKFEYFNPIQTQIFHTLYHTDNNTLLGAPTGSGKTIAAEIAMFRVFEKYPGTKAVYIAPLKALVRERIEDWKVRFVQQLQKNVVELTGDVTPDVKSIATADVIVTTPEKWDGISRSWQTRDYVKSISLIVIDEIHLLGESRGPVLEVIVSRTNFISAYTEKKVRLIGLSTALANANDLANWLGIKKIGLYNFKPSVRPVPLAIHISGHHGKHYCPRMAIMNKPTYRAIQMHSPEKPVLIFVSSRRQTRLTALDLIAFLAVEDNPRQWVRLSDDEVQLMICDIKDQNLKLTLAFGIGLHHAGLNEHDRKLVEALFLHEKIQVLIATATLAWGVNLPAHLVVIKGTEYFDGKTHRYVDFPVTDVLQMMGRAGRPQFDTEGVAVILVQDLKKEFYKNFLHNPFPVESSLIEVLPDHLNAEIAAGTIGSKQQCLDYLTWTYYFRRLLQNPGFYGLEEISHETMNDYLSRLVNGCLANLEISDCIKIGEDNRFIEPTTLGRIASFYYLNYKTINSFNNKLNRNNEVDNLLGIVCEASEFDELPVRHNEDSINEELAKDKRGIRVEPNPYTFDNPHTKASLLLQAHFSRLTFPCSDYYTDLKSVLDSAIRVIQALIDVASDKGVLSTTLGAMTLLQMVVQACWHDDNSILTLPHIEPEHLNYFRFSDEFSQGKSSKQTIADSLPKVMFHSQGRIDLLESILHKKLSERQISDISKTLNTLPWIEVKCSLKAQWATSSSRQIKPLQIHKISGKTPSSFWMQVQADSECSLNVQLRRLSRIKRDTKALAPRFPKQKDEGWFLVLGDVDKRELVAMKRIPYIHERATHRLVFYAPVKKTQVLYTLFLISDCYMGLDQQYSIYIETDDGESNQSSSDSESSESDEL